MHRELSARSPLVLPREKKAERDCEWRESIGGLASFCPITRQRTTMCSYELAYAVASSVLPDIDEDEFAGVCKRTEQLMELPDVPDATSERSSEAATVPFIRGMPQRPASPLAAALERSARRAERRAERAARRAYVRQAEAQLAKTLGVAYTEEQTDEEEERAREEREESEFERAEQEEEEEEEEEITDDEEDEDDDDHEIDNTRMLMEAYLRRVYVPPAQAALDEDADDEEEEEEEEADETFAQLAQAHEADDNYIDEPYDDVALLRRMLDAKASREEEEERERFFSDNQEL